MPYYYLFFALYISCIIPLVTIPKSLVTRSIDYRDNVICEIQTIRLISYADPWTKPRLIDSFYSTNNNTTTVVMLLSYSYLSIKNFTNNISLLYKGNYYQNKYSSYSFVNIQLLLFQLPETKEIIRSDSLTLSNNLGNEIIYKDFPICKRTYAKQANLVLCTHISLYNSLAEIVNWVGFHLLQGIDIIVIYVCQKVGNLTILLSKEIHDGRVILVDFLWPVGKGYIQRKYQTETMTSCYYRYRHISSSILFFDVDEYIFSRKYPFSLPKAVNELWIDGHNHANIFAHFYYCNNRSTDREVILQNGELFSSHTSVIIPRSKSHRQKNIVHTSFEGQIRQHWVIGNKKSKSADSEILQIAHFKDPKRKNNPRDNITRIDNSLNIYSKSMRLFWVKKKKYL